MKYSLRHNEHQNHNFRKFKNYVKVEGFRKVFFKRLSKTLSNPQFDCKNRVPKR